MKALTRVLIVAAFSTALIPLGAQTALACSCAPPLSDPNAVADSDVVFAGYAISAGYPNEVRNVNDTLGKIRWTFLPETLVKGLDAGPVDIMSHSQGAACGVSFNIGRRYLVFASDEEGALTANSCSPTRTFYEEVELTGAEQVPGSFGPRTGQGSDGPNALLVAAVVGGTLLLLAGIALFYRRRGNASADEELVP